MGDAGRTTRHLRKLRLISDELQARSCTDWGFWVEQAAKSCPEDTAQVTLSDSNVCEDHLLERLLEGEGCASFSSTYA